MFFPVYEDKMLFNVFLFLLNWLKEWLYLKIAYLFVMEGFLRKTDIVGWDDHILCRVAVQDLLHFLPFSLHIFNRIEDLLILV